MAETTTTTTAVATRETQVATIADFLKKNEARLNEELAGMIDPGVLTRVSITTIRKSKDLPSCTPESLLEAIIEAGQLGFEPTGRYGGAWLVPFKSKSGVIEAKMIPDYRGLMELARQSDRVESFEADIIYAKDKYEYRRGVNPTIEVFPPLDDDRGSFRAAYAVAWIRNARHPQIELMTKGQIDGIRARSKAKDAGPWVTDYDRMALKTVIRRLCGMLPGKSSQLKRALAAEDDTYDLDPVLSQRADRRGVTGLGNRLKVVTEPQSGGQPAAEAAPIVDAQVETTAAPAEPTEEEKQKAEAERHNLANAVRNGAEHAKITGAWLVARIKARTGAILRTADGKLDLEAQPESILRGLLEDLEAELTNPKQ